MDLETYEETKDYDASIRNVPNITETSIMNEKEPIKRINKSSDALKLLSNKILGSAEESNYSGIKGIIAMYNIEANIDKQIAEYKKTMNEDLLNEVENKPEDNINERINNKAKVQEKLNKLIEDKEKLKRSLLSKKASIITANRNSVIRTLKDNKYPKELKAYDVM